MKEKHYIKKVLNNNVVFSKNKDGKDIILTGLGLGFQKKKGEFVDENKIEQLMENKDIIRNRRKIAAAIKNADSY